MRAQFIRGQDPKKSMKIGTAYLEDKVKELQSKKEYLDDKDFEDDRLIIYLFKKNYDKWLEIAGSVKPEDVEIWGDTTSGSSLIIKISAPGVRETTLLRGEAYYSLVSEDVVKFLNSPEIKKKISNEINSKNADLNKLAEMIFAAANRKKLQMGSWITSKHIAEKLINLFQ